MRIGTFVTYKGFTGSIEYDFNDKIYHGELLDIPDQIAYHADSMLELWEHYQKRVDNYIRLLKIKEKVTQAKGTDWGREGFSDQEVEEIVREAKSSIRKTNTAPQ